MVNRQMKLGLNLVANGAHAAGWRMPDAKADAAMDIGLWQDMARAAERAFAMAGLQRSDIDMASIYDCYTITVLMTLEDAGFCGKGEGMSWLTEHDLTFRGDFPTNTAGGQLSYGQAGIAGGMHHVVDGARQVMGRSGEAQVRDCDTAFVTGNGGIMSEQVALILGGD